MPITFPGASGRSNYLMRRGVSSNLARGAGLEFGRSAHRSSCEFATRFDEDLFVHR
jgi:hypothetical protein